MKLENRVIIITGASKGLGVAMAEACAAEGAKVVCAARDAKALDGVVSDIHASGEPLRQWCVTCPGWRIWSDW